MSFIFNDIFQGFFVSRLTGSSTGVFCHQNFAGKFLQEVVFFFFVLCKRCPLRASHAAVSHGTPKRIIGAEAVTH